MAHRRRLSVSSTRSVSPLVFAVSNPETEEWIAIWEQVLAKDLIDSPVIAIDAETTVEDACDALLSQNVPCIAINRPKDSPSDGPPYIGLFDYPDVNAFLVIAATRHRWSQDDLRERPRTEKIIAAAKAGRVPVSLVSNLSGKNPLQILPHTASIIQLLTVFSKGAHRVLIKAPDSSTEYLGMVSDKSLLEWFAKSAQKSSTLFNFLSTPLSSLALPSVYLYSSVVSCKANDSVLHAMRLMSDFGVSSVAVLEEENGGLLSAVSVTDIGKIVVPSQSNQILTAPLHLLVSLIKEPDGSTDGVDKFPVYSVSPSSTLLYSMQKILATNSHRLFVSDDSLPVPQTSACLSGVVSIVDVLALFARVANLPNVDPTSMQRHRRASSISSGSSDSIQRSPDLGNVFVRSRSGSRTGIRRMSGTVTSPSSGMASSVSSLDSFSWSERVPR